MTETLPLVTRNSPLRILTVADVQSDPNSGAAGTVVYTNAALRELGHSVDEIWSTDLGPRLISHGNLHSLIEQPRQYVRAIRKAFLNKEYDVVIAQQPQAWMAARDHRRLKRDAVFLTMSQGVETRIWEVLQRFRAEYNVPAGRFPHRLLTEPLQRLLRRQWQYAVEYSDGLIVQHSQDKDYLCHHHSASEARVHISASGLTQAFLETPLRSTDEQKRKRILYVGQDAFYKGVDCLIGVVSTVLRQNPDAKFSWVCSAEHHNRISARFPSEVIPQIQLLPWTDQVTLIKVLDQHGVFLFPTLAEGFAKAPLEAMSRGLIVIASDCCGMRDYMSGYPSQLCEVGNVQQFSQRVSLALAGAYDESRQHVIETARRHTWNASAKEMIGFFRQYIQTVPQ